MTHLPYRVHPAARRDLETISDRLVNDRGADAGLHFIECARQIFLKIGEQPDVGSPVATRNVRLIGLRKRTIAGFPRFLVFYQAGPDGPFILRVLDSRQDWWALLDVN